MENQTPIPNDHPLKLAWDEYIQTGEYANSCRWIREGDEYTTDSLWAIFVAGYNAGVKAVATEIANQI